MNRSALRTLTAVVAAATAASIVGCGKTDTPATAAAARPSATKTGSDQAASAEDVARQARRELACPAKTATPPRAAGMPVDDVLGVRPGLGYAEAMSMVLCSHPLLVAAAATGRGFDLKAPQASQLRQGFTARAAEPHVVQSSREILQEMQRDTIARGSNALREDLKPGQVKWFVGTMGLAGQERVLSVAREERFPVGQNPTVDSVFAALIEKYGPPSLEQRASSTSLPIVRWAHDPSGRFAGADSPLSGRCRGVSDPDGAASLSSECGLVVQAILIPQKSNPDLVDRLQVGVVDQTAGLRLIDQTEQALGQGDQQRRALEVEKAAKTAKAPSL